MQSGCILDPLLLLDVFKVVFFGSTILNNIYYWYQHYEPLLMDTLATPKVTITNAYKGLPLNYHEASFPTLINKKNWPPFVGTPTRVQVWESTTLCWCFFELQNSFGFKELKVPREPNYLPFWPTPISWIYNKVDNL